MPKPPINYTPVDKWSEPLVALYEEMTDALIINIARHFSVADDPTPTQQWRYIKLAELGKLTDESANIISSYVRKEQALVRFVLIGAALAAVEKNEPDLLAAVKEGLFDTTHASISDSIKSILASYQQQAINTLNMVNTTMLQSTLDAYRKVVADTTFYEQGLASAQSTLNTVTAEVITGVISRGEAVRKAVAQMVAAGITGFYDKADRRWSAEAYVNMDIRTTTGNVALQATMTRNAEYGNDLIWVPINWSARPKCYPWQGKVISTENRSGTTTDLDGKTIEIHPLNLTSYGEPDGLFGINCHHTPPNVFIPRVSVIRGEVPPKDVNDARYAETQNQRRYEREVRYAKRDAAVANATGDKEAFKKAAKKVKTATERYKEYSEEHGLPTYAERMQVLTYEYDGKVYKYDRSIAAKITAANRETKEA